MITDAAYSALLETRMLRPSELIAGADARTRPEPMSEGHNLLIVAADHPARRSLRVGSRPTAMAARRDLLERLVLALSRPGVDGVVATPDILEDLLYLGALDGKIVFGSMNRGGLVGSAWELADGPTAYDADSLQRSGFEGGKMLVRIDYADTDTRRTLEWAAQAISRLASLRLIAMVEPLPVRRNPAGDLQLMSDSTALAEAVAVASALGNTSAYTWLKVPAADDPEVVMGATTLPCLMLGGDAAGASDALMDRWRRGLAVGNVRGLVAGRSLLYPEDGGVEARVDAAAALVHGS